MRRVYGAPDRFTTQSFTGFRSRTLPELKLAAAVAKAVLAAHPDAQEPESEKAPADLSWSGVLRGTLALRQSGRPRKFAPWRQTPSCPVYVQCALALADAGDREAQLVHDGHQQIR